MDFRKLIDTHQATNADVTIAVLPVPREQVPGFGIVQLDKTGRVVSFIEKPQTEEAIAPYFTPPEWMAQFGVKSNNRPYLASMGIYLFSRKALLELLYSKPLATDFGKEIFPRSIGPYRVQAYMFDGYWEDLGTIKAYHESSLALASDNPPFDFSSPEGVIYTRMRFLPASRICNATLKEVLVSDGCIIESGTQIEKSIIGVRSRIGRNATLRNVVMIGADRFETDNERLANREKGVPNLNVGNGAVIEQAILDKDCRIGANARLVNARGVENEDGENYLIRDGIICIPRGTVIPEGTVI
jgi:glucose-1-phosphate adenylyltransferase